MPGGSICRAHQAVDHPGLAADFRGEPARQDRDQTRGAHPHSQVQEEAVFVKAVTLAQPQAPQTGEDHQETEADHDPERPEHNGRVRPVFWRELLKCRHLFVQRMGQNQAAQIGNLHGEAGFLSLHVRPAEENQRGRLVADILPVTFDGGNFCRLVLEGIKAMEVADHRLDRRHDQRHPHGHRQHGANCRVVPATQQVPGRRGADEERCRDKRGRGHMHQAVREGWVEHHRQPIHRNHSTIDDFITLGRLHPTVGRQDPEGRDQGADRHHHGGEEVQAAANLVPAKQHDAEEAGFEEERRQHLISQQGSGDCTGEVGEATPVGPELVGHDQAGNHSHAEVDGKDLRPKMIQIAVRIVTRLQPQPFEHRQVARQANGDGREQDME